MSEPAEAGPSHQVPKRKPRAPHPDSRSVKRTKYAPPLPPPLPSSHPTTKANGHLPTLQNKVLQGQSARRTEIKKPGYGRDVVFVTRKVSLGALMGRARSLLVDEGYTRITLFALGAAIPHALLLLHALIDLLPYPKGPKGMWYEIQTGTTECVDEVEPGAGTDDGKEEEFAGLGAVEAQKTERKTRLNSTIRINLHITPKPAPKTETKSAGKKRKENRPSKQKRQALLRKRQAEILERTRTACSGDEDEEEMMNQRDELDEEEETVEEK